MQEFRAAALDRVEVGEDELLAIRSLLSHNAPARPGTSLIQLKSQLWSEQRRGQAFARKMLATFSQKSCIIHKLRGTI